MATFVRGSRKTSSIFSMEAMFSFFWAEASHCEFQWVEAEFSWGKAVNLNKRVLTFGLNAFN